MNWSSIRVPLSRYDIDVLEKDLNITLPEDYKSQIGPLNGGALRDTYIKLPKLGKISYSRNVSLQRGAKAGIYDDKLSSRENIPFSHNCIAATQVISFEQEYI